MSHALRLQADGKISNDDFTKLLSALDPNQTPVFQHVFIDFDDICAEQMTQLTQAISNATLTNLEMAFTIVDEQSAKAFQEAVSKNPQIKRARLELGTHLFYFSAQSFNDMRKDLHMDFSPRAIIDCQTITAEQVPVLAEQLKRGAVTDLTMTIREFDATVAESLAQAVNDIEALKRSKLVLGDYTIIRGYEEEDVVERFANMMIATVETNIGRVTEGMKGVASSLLTQSRGWMSAFSAPFTQCVAGQPLDDGLDALSSPKEREKAALGKLV